MEKYNFYEIKDEYFERLERMENELIELYGVSQETITIIEGIDGYNSEKLHDILFFIAGERQFSFEQEEEEEGETNNETRGN